MGKTSPVREPPPSRVTIEGVTPEIDAGRFPAKRILGDCVRVEADVFTDGHDLVAGAVRHRLLTEGPANWTETPLTAPNNDRWSGSFNVDQLGIHEFVIEAWIDRFGTWAKDLAKKSQAGQDVSSDLIEGARLIEQAAERAAGPDQDELRSYAKQIQEHPDSGARVEVAEQPALRTLMSRYIDPSERTRYPHVLRILVEPERARYGAWYELFPRSCASQPGQHGTLRDVIGRLPYVARLGFDVLYLPPIHPIGRSFRKGPNNTLDAGPDDPGSPWGIGAAEGGHTAIHPDLGTLADFDDLLVAAGEHNIELALDVAFQCAPDHPWVREHPEWFRHRPDGTIKYAENPPKKYQDIYPLDFECSEWKALWHALRDSMQFWIDRGVRIFRVDNPHTKPFRFWEWLMHDLREQSPDLIFLSEAFTRPKVMRHLAKCGFSQSYTYFTWRTTKAALIEYFTELTRPPVCEYMRPNLFANTPDILHEFLQVGGRPAFQLRLALAATLGASYGIYGPPFEQCVSEPVHHGSEEYKDSEKYQVRYWDLDAPGNLTDYIARINTIRRENPALHADDSLEFYPIDNEQLLAYGKCSPDRSNVVVTVVNLDPRHRQAGWLRLPIDALGLDPNVGFQAHDLISDARYLWHGTSSYIEIDPHASPAQIFRLRRRVKTECDFDYYF